MSTQFKPDRVADTTDRKKNARLADLLGSGGPWNSLPVVKVERTVDPGSKKPGWLVTFTEEEDEE